MIIFPFKTFQTTPVFFPTETISIDMDIVVLQHDMQYDMTVRPIFFRKMFSANSSKPFLGQDNQFA